MADIASDLRPPAGELAGRVRVHMPLNYGRHRIAPLLAGFLRAHPQVRIEAVYDDAFVDMVAGKVDLAVRLGPLGDAQLVARKIGAMRRFLCASPGYLASAPPLRDPNDLRQHRCIGFSGLRTGTLWQLSRQRQRRSVRVDPVLACNDAQVIRDAALADIGIGLQGDYMADALVAAGRLVQVLPDWQLSTLPVHLLWLPGADRTPVLRRLIDHLAGALAPA